MDGFFQGTFREFSQGSWFFFPSLILVETKYKIIESVRLFSAEKSRGFQVHLAGFLPLSVSVVLDLLLVKPAGFGAKPLMIAVVYHQVLPLFSVVPSFYTATLVLTYSFPGDSTWK